MNGVDPLGLAEAGQAAWGPYPILYATKLSDHLWVHFANIPATISNTVEAVALQPIRDIPVVIGQAEEAASGWLADRGVTSRSLAEGLDDFAAVGVANPLEGGLAVRGLAQAASYAKTAMRAKLSVAAAEAAAVAERAGALEYGVGAARTGEVSASGRGARYVSDSRAGQYRDVATGRFVSPRDLPWPASRGFASSTQGIVQPGTVIGRFGKPTGRYAGQPGATVSARGMAPGADAAVYTQYEVLRPLPAEVGPAAAVPAFGADGGATQYLFEQSISELVEQGFLRAVK